MSALSLEMTSLTEAGTDGRACDNVVNLDPDPDLELDLELDLDRALEIFLTERTSLFHIARRVTGDVPTALDVVQETWLRWQGSDRKDIKNPAAFLTTTTTHLAINVIQSARHRHETGAELPLADLIDPTQDPTVRAEQTAAVARTLQLLMSRLRPAELAAYLLSKAFCYPYGDIAALLQTSSANARQLSRRAQQRIGGDRELAVDRHEHAHLVAAFLTAARSGDLAPLEELLARNARTCIRPHQRPPVRPAHASTSPQLGAVLGRLDAGETCSDTTASGAAGYSAGDRSARPSTT